MMRKYLVFILAAILIASCGTRPSEETDWCYIQDFRTSQTGINIVGGAWIEGVGLRTAAGYLSFSYEYEGDFVTPAIIYVNVVRPDGVVGTITVAAGGTVYGVSTSFTANMTSNEETVHFTPATYGDAGKEINVSVNAFDKDLIVSYIIVEGYDPNPFPRNDCEEQDPFATASATLTVPVEYTATPTDTPTATWTPTATFTPSPTPTATETPGCGTLSYNFLTNNGGWYISDENNAAPDSGNARYVGGSGWGNSVIFGTHYHVVIIAKDLGSTKTILRVTATMTKIPLNLYSVNTWTNTTTVVNSYSTSHPSSSYLDTGSISDTARYVRFYLNNDTDGSTPWNPYTGFVTAITIDYCDAPNTTPTPTLTPTGGDTLTPPMIPTNTPFNFQPTVDLTETTATPSVSPTVTNTDFPRSTAYATAEAGEGTPTYSVEEIRENEAEWEILEEEKRGNNASENLLQDILEAIQNQNTGTSNSSGSGAGTGDNTGTGVGDGASDITAGVGATLGDASDVFGSSGNYLGDALSGLNGLLTSFYTTPPQPFPGLPQCMTHPLEHDICAIYYVLDWTLFAPNTIGQFIIPVLLAMMKVIFIFKIVGYVLRLVGKTEDITR